MTAGGLNDAGMTRNLLIAAVVALVSCSEPATSSIDEALTVCYFDCPICYPSCGPCVEVCYSCPAIEPPEPPVGDLPRVGSWVGGWQCDTGCGQPAPGITQATTLIIVTNGNDEAVWRKSTVPMTLLKASITEDGTCWTMDAFDAWPAAPGELGCRSAIEICGTYCSEMSPPSDCVRAHATWTDLTSGLQQTWTFRGIQ